MTRSCHAKGAHAHASVVTACLKLNSNWSIKSQRDLARPLQASRPSLAFDRNRPCHPPWLPELALITLPRSYTKWQIDWQSFRRSKRNVGRIDPHKGPVQLGREACVNEPASERFAEVQSTTSAVLIVHPATTERRLLAGRVLAIAVCKRLWAARDQQARS